MRAFLFPIAVAAHSVTYSDLLRPGGPSSTGFTLPPRSATVYTKHTFSADVYPLASCLDGGPGAFYVRSGDPKRIRVFFQGGGWCTSDEDCFARSKTDLGSTKNLPATSVDPAGCKFARAPSRKQIRALSDYPDPNRLRRQLSQL